VRIVVTGGAGFIGRHTVTHLLAAGHDLAVLDLASEEVADARVGDVRDLATVEGVLAGADVVVHLAAKVGLGVDLDDIDDYVSANCLGTAVVLKAMGRLGVPRLVLASSMVVYGEGRYTCAMHGVQAAPPRRVEDLEAGRFEPACPECEAPLRPELVGEEAAPDPRNTYASTKLHGEHLAAGWARETGGTALALRFHNVYGPGMPRDTPYAGVAAIFRSALEHGRPAEVFEDGGQRRDFVHVTDVAAAVGAACAGGRPGELRAYNVGSGTVRTIGDLAGALSDVYDGPEPKVTGAYRLGDVRHITASSERIRRELGWQARIALADGVNDL
jgi:dTDP-L-rhamnose 4-epimerase